MNDTNLEIKIEAILFFKAEPQSFKRLAEILSVTEAEIKIALQTLTEKLVGRGLQLIIKDDAVTITTSTSVSSIIEKITKDELIRDLGKAGLETLSIIAYKGPISRAEIDYIRGVQSNFILRNLQIRGLVEKITDSKDQRKLLYRPTFELLSFLGVSRIEDLPEFEKVKAEFDQLSNNAVSENQSEAVNSNIN